MDTKTKAADILVLLLWGLDRLLNPSPARILESFEAWNYRNRLRPQLRLLERAKFLEREKANRSGAFQLTEKGRLAALGGVDPEQRWRRPWDGQWRLLLFDLRSERHKARVRLWRWLRLQRFGYLQNSVWITPDVFDVNIVPLNEETLDAEMCAVMNAQPGSGLSHAAIVSGAWDFTEINRLYRTHLEVLEDAEGFTQSGRPNSASLRKWLAEERLAWLAASTADPFLPDALLPDGYLGRQAWQKRRSVISRLTQQLAKTR